MKILLLCFFGLIVTVSGTVWLESGFLQGICQTASISIGVLSLLLLVSGYFD